jgi:hypothetical protein
MRKLAGYLCHRASVRLHEEAVRLLPIEGREWWTCEPIIERHGSSDQVPDTMPLTLSDVAPRLADALDVARHNLERMRTMVGRRKET